MYLFINHILYALVFIAISFFSGYLLMRLFKVPMSRNYGGIFSISVIGTFFIVSVFAIIITKGSTILLGVLLIGFFLLYDQRREKIKMEDQHSLSIIFFVRKFYELAVVASCIIGYKLLFKQTGIFLIEPSYHDYVFYSKASKYILETGIENVTLDYVFLDKFIAPYHYFDLWMNSLLLKVTGGNAVELMILSSYTIGCALIWLGFVSLIELFFVPNLFTKLLAFILLFYSGIYLGNVIHNPLVESSNVFTLHVISYGKLFPLYIVIILIIRAFHKNRNGLIITLLMAMPLLNISTAPGVFILSGIICLLYLIKKDKLAWSMISKVFLMAIFIFLLYLWKGAKVGSASTLTPGSYLELSYLKTFINIIGGAAIQVVIIYFLFFIIVLMAWKTDKAFFYRYILILALCFFSFIIPWALFHKTPNSIQFFSNFMVVFLSCFSIYYIFFIMKHATTGVYRWVSILVLVGLPIVSIYSDTILRSQLLNKFKDNKISQQEIIFFNRIKNPLGVYFRKHDDWASKFPVFGAKDASYQQFISRPGFHTVSLSVFDTPVDNSGSSNYEYERALITGSEFGKFVGNNNAMNEISMVNYQIRFIKKYAIDYVIADIDYEFPDALKVIVNAEFKNEALKVKVFSVKR